MDRSTAVKFSIQVNYVLLAPLIEPVFCGILGQAKLWTLLKKPKETFLILTST